jgi:hypothetical protein
MKRRAAIPTAWATVRLSGALAASPVLHDDGEFDYHIVPRDARATTLDGEPALLLVGAANGTATIDAPLAISLPVAGIGERRHRTGGAGGRRLSTATGAPTWRSRTRGPATSPCCCADPAAAWGRRVGRRRYRRRTATSSNPSRGRPDPLTCRRRAGWSPGAPPRSMPPSTGWRDRERSDDGAGPCAAGRRSLTVFRICLTPGPSPNGE